ncbi:MAG: metalloregulator ArsR/SmtB family transcription factor [Verrucomicrobiales bacterium]|nr:metalloregulator ArsR/SmtB family transcription factor [Verrucomicrobiales bacterium]
MSHQKIKIPLVEDYLSVYKCLGELTRLRILNLLKHGPLCVCHVQDVLGEPQPKVSKQLAYLKRHGVIESLRHANWTIYRLSGEPGSILAQNLKCLEDGAFQESVFLEDLERLRQVDTSAACLPGEG